MRVKTGESHKVYHCHMNLFNVPVGVIKKPGKKKFKLMGIVCDTQLELTGRATN